MDLLNTSNGRLIKNKKIDIVRLKKSVTFGHILFIFLITNTYKYLNYSYFFYNIQCFGSVFYFDIDPNSSPRICFCKKITDSDSASNQTIILSDFFYYPDPVKKNGSETLITISI